MRCCQRLTCKWATCPPAPAWASTPRSPHGLWHISEDELLHGYRELSDLAGHCKFRNCSHRNEPGCALIMAAESGEISEERLANFYQIADTLDEDGRERYS